MHASYLQQFIAGYNAQEIIRGIANPSTGSHHTSPSRSNQASAKFFQGDSVFGQRGREWAVKNLVLWGWIGVFLVCDFCSIMRTFFGNRQKEFSMALDVAVPEYSSPLRKLVSCFRSSRDRWKQKCRETKRANKLLMNQVRAVERSRDSWKQRVADQRLRIAELQAELDKNR
jgi:hypothetical protein